MQQALNFRSETFWAIAAWHDETGAPWSLPSPGHNHPEALRAWCQNVRQKHGDQPDFDLRAFKRVVEGIRYHDEPLATRETADLKATG